MYQPEGSTQAGPGVEPCGLARRAGESAKAFEAAQAYVAMGGGRSIAGLARQLGKSARLLERWSSQYGWRERAAAWDERKAQALLARDLDETVSSIAAARRRRLALAERLLDAGEEMAAELLRRCATDPGAISTKELLAGVERSVRLSWDIYGEPANLAWGRFLARKMFEVCMRYAPEGSMDALLLDLEMAMRSDGGRA